MKLEFGSLPLDWIIATKNFGKFREISSGLQGLGLRLRALSEFPDILDVDENQESFEGNARIKASSVVERLKLPVIADDSGLVVKALGGQPGVRSARYAGPKASDQENLEKLLKAMERVPAGQREAAYVCVLVIGLPSGKEWIIREECWGEIAFRPKGSGGFGYDPIFFIPETQKTMAELSIKQKNTISHRGKAIQKLRELFGCGAVG
ncbi:MAG: XTP/dITP diphosphatase [Deltaproteobacteria bacterium]|nr:XTP/dITP diphosphatase [Deltaproteobacteria bacterium]